MVIHVISTINGDTNEGMRNVATHLSKEFEKENTVLYSGLKQIFNIIVNTCKADVTIVFARANSVIFELLRIITKLSRNVWMVLVQKPDSDFIAKNEKNTLGCNYFYIYEDDIREIKQLQGGRNHKLSIGINKEKFTPVTLEEQLTLKKKYGYSLDKPLILHVGHCSVGRGLETFVEIQDAQKVVLTSGMFENAEVVDMLRKAKVDVYTGYRDDVQEFYQMADVYLFPTKSAEYVISIPLSVIEALSCGVPVIGYQSFRNLQEINSVEDSIILIDDADEINKVLKKIKEKKSEQSLLKGIEPWEKVAESVLKNVREKR